MKRIYGNPDLLCAIAIVAVGAFYILTIREGHNWGGDFSQYILHAKNLVDRGYYSIPEYIANYSHSFISPIEYPPIFPLLLTPAYILFGINFVAFKVTVIISLCLALFAIYFTFRDRLTAPLSIGLILILGFNPYFWIRLQPIW